MSKPWHRQPVPPLSEQAWNRIRAGVLPELDLDQSVRPRSSAPALRRRYRTAAGVIGLVAVAAVLMFFIGRRVPSSSAPAPSRIVAARDVTRATIGDVLVEVAPGTEFVVTGAEQAGHTVVLERGHATFNVPRRAGRAPFAVQASDALIEVIGTRFTVWRANDFVRVSVARGTVRVTFRGEETVLLAGGEWASRPSSPEGSVPAAAPAPRQPLRPAPLSVQKISSGSQKARRKNPRT